MLRLVYRSWVEGGQHRWLMTLGHLPCRRMALLLIGGLPNNHCAHTALWGGDAECVQSTAQIGFLNLKTNERTTVGKLLNKKVIAVCVVYLLMSLNFSALQQSYILDKELRLSRKENDLHTYIPLQGGIKWFIFRNFFFFLKRLVLNENTENNNSHIWNLDAKPSSFCSIQNIFSDLLHLNYLFLNYYYIFIFFNYSWHRPYQLQVHSTVIRHFYNWWSPR